MFSFFMVALLDEAMITRICVLYLYISQAYSLILLIGMNNHVIFFYCC